MLAPRQRTIRAASAARFRRGRSSELVRRPRTSERPGQRGFNLIEMLVVTAMLGVLAGLLLPAVSRAQSKARSVQCVSHFRQLGLGLRMYAESDPFSRLPVDPIGDSAPAWVYALTPHVGSVDGIRICPSDKFGEARRQWKRTSYVRNQYTAREASLSLTDEGTPSAINPELVINPSSVRLTSFRRPAETFLAFEGSNVGVLFPPMADAYTPVPAFDDHTHPDTWILGWAHVLADIDPERHGRASNYLFADGHVESIVASTLRRRIEAGDNFAAIPE